MSSFPDVTNMQRPRRRLSVVLREIISCPLCIGTRVADYPVNIVRWRERTVRVECAACGLRFSLDIPELVKTLRDHPDPVIAKHIALFGYTVQEAGKDSHDKHELQAVARELADWIESVHEFAPSPVSTPPSRTK